MKQVAFILEDNRIKLKEKLDKWITENEDSILELLGIEYGQDGKIHYVTITYLD